MYDIIMFVCCYHKIVRNILLKCFSGSFPIMLKSLVIAMYIVHVHSAYYAPCGLFIASMLWLMKQMGTICISEHPLAISSLIFYTALT